MLARRVIVCLDVDAGRVVKGVRFRSLRDVGQPAALAARYEAEGADELVFLDITASAEERDTTLEAVRRTAERLFVPLTVGGGMRTVDDAARALRAGADKIAVNTAAVLRPALLAECADRFGAQCVVASIDALVDETRPSGYGVRIRGARTPTVWTPWNGRSAAPGPCGRNSADRHPPRWRTDRLRRQPHPRRGRRRFRSRDRQRGRRNSGRLRRSSFPRARRCRSRGGNLPRRGRRGGRGEGRPRVGRPSRAASRAANEGDRMTNDAPGRTSTPSTSIGGR